MPIDREGILPQVLRADDGEQPLTHGRERRYAVGPDSEGQRAVIGLAAAAGAHQNSRPIEQQRTLSEAMGAETAALSEIVEQLVERPPCSAAHQPVDGVASRAAVESPQRPQRQQHLADVGEIAPQRYPQRAAQSQLCRVLDLRGIRKFHVDCAHRRKQTAKSP